MDGGYVVPLSSVMPFSLIVGIVGGVGPIQEHQPRPRPAKAAERLTGEFSKGGGCGMRIGAKKKGKERLLAQNDDLLRTGEGKTFSSWSTEIHTLWS